MVKKNQKVFNWLNRLADMVIIYFSYFISVLVWIFLLKNDTSNISVTYVLVNPLPTLLAAFGAVVVFQYGGMYDSFRFSSVEAELVQLFKLWLICCGFAAGFVFFFKQLNFSRGVLGLLAICAYILLSIKRIILRLILRRARRSGYNKKHVLLVGSGELAEKYVSSINDNPQFGYDCMGYVGREGSEALGMWLGDYSELEGLLEKQPPDELVIAIEPGEMAMMNVLLSLCEEQGVRANIIPVYNDFLPSCATVDVLGNVRLINLRLCPLDISLNSFMKRCFDIVFSLAAIIISSPVLLITAVGVKLSSPGPILFRQQRVGRNRENFNMLKFRSMRVNDESDTAWSRSRDSRVTPFGAFIRKCSIDELPQFFNVLRGEMSVIGPRPELPHFVERYKYEIPRYMVKHQVKPGITGWAQVNGYRGDTSLEKRIECDIWYIENWSLLLDIKIVFMTVFGGMINGEKNLGRDKEKEEK